MAAPNISLLGATYSGVSGVTLPKQGGGTATFPWVEGSDTKTANGTYDVTNLAQVVVNVSGGGSGKNAQISAAVGRVNVNTYTDVSGISIKVSKAGTYDVYWTGWRTSTSGTSGSELVVNGTVKGSAYTTFDSTYTNVQNIHVSNVTLAQNDTVTIKARARSSSYYMYVFNLVIIEA